MQVSRTLPLASGLILLALAASGCGAVDGLRDTETADEARAALADDPTTTEAMAVLEEEPAPVTVAEEEAAEPASTEPAADNVAAWAEIDRAAQTFAARLDEATQGIASCQTEAAAGADFEACLGGSFRAIAAAGDEMVALVDGAAERADGPCRDALRQMGGATREMAADYRAAIGITDLTSLDTAYLEIADDAGAYAEAAMAAAGACAAG